MLGVTTHITEKEILLQSDSDNDSTVRCLLRGSWINCRVEEGDTVNVLAERDESSGGAFKVDDMSGLLVVNPDALVSGTSVVSTLFCMRKAVLNETFKGMEGKARILKGLLIS